MKRAAWLAAIPFLLCACAFHGSGHHAHGEAQAMPKPTPPPVAIKTLLDAVGRPYLIAAGVPASLAVGYADPQQISYAQLLTVLRNNGLAGVTVDGVLNIVPMQMVRSHPIPTVNEDRPDIPDHEWVSRVIPLRNVPAPQLVPILRPLLPRAGHLAAAAEQNALLVVDHYGNVRRLTGLVRDLDESSRK